MDWVAIGSIGTFLTFVVTLITIFKKDKDIQKQIDQLAGIVEVLKTQDNTMRAQNDLIAQEVEILRNLTVSKMNDNSALVELKNIEQKKLKLSVRPDIKVNGSYQGFSGEMQLHLHNTGERATITLIKPISNDVSFYPFIVPVVFEKGQQIDVRGRQSGAKNIKDCEYRIELYFSDKLDFKFLAIIEGKGTSAKITSIEDIEK